MPTEIPSPFQQGALDALCAVYAVVNAVRLAAPPELRPSQHASHALFGALLRGLRRRRILYDSLVLGVSPENMRDVLDDAAKWLAKAGMTLTWRRPFAGIEAMRLDAWLAAAAAHLAEPGGGAIVCVAGAISHWTALRGVGAGTLKLFDSSGRQQLALSACDAGLDGDDARYQLAPSELFLITVKAKP